MFDEWNAFSSYKLWLLSFVYANSCMSEIRNTFNHKLFLSLLLLCYSKGRSINKREIITIKEITHTKSRTKDLTGKTLMNKGKSMAEKNSLSKCLHIYSSFFFYNVVVCRPCNKCELIWVDFKFESANTYLCVNTPPQIEHICRTHSTYFHFFSNHLYKTL